MNGCRTTRNLIMVVQLTSSWQGFTQGHKSNNWCVIGQTILSIMVQQLWISWSSNHVDGSKNYGCGQHEFNHGYGLASKKLIHGYWYPWIQELWMLNQQHYQVWSATPAAWKLQWPLRVAPNRSPFQRVALYPKWLIAPNSIQQLKMVTFNFGSFHTEFGHNKFTNFEGLPMKNQMN